MCIRTSVCTQTGSYVYTYQFLLRLTQICAHDCTESDACLHVSDESGYTFAQFNGSEWPTCMNTSVCTQSGSDVYTTSVGLEWLMHACICVESGSHVCIHSVGQNDVARMY